MVQVRSTADGSVIRTIGVAEQPYPVNGLGLTPDGAGAFYVDLDVSSGRVGIVWVTGQGSPKFLAYGTAATLSPDGRKMAYLGEKTLAVMDLSSGEQQQWPRNQLFTGVPGEIAASPRNLAWVGAGDRLAILTATPPRIDDSFVSSPSPSPLPPRASHITVLNLATDRVEKVVPGPAASAFDALGPGANAGSLLLGSRSAATNDGAIGQLQSIDLTSGTSAQIRSLPPASHAVSIDPGGNFVIYQTDSQSWFWQDVAGAKPPVHIADDLMTAGW